MRTINYKKKNSELEISYNGIYIKDENGATSFYECDGVEFTSILEDLQDMVKRYYTDPRTDRVILNKK